MSGRLHNKIAIVTGAGSGIGRAITLRFVQEGADILGVDRNDQGLQETVTLGSTADALSI